MANYMLPFLMRELRAEDDFFSRVSGHPVHISSNDLAGLIVVQSIVHQAKHQVEQHRPSFAKQWLQLFQF